MVSFLVQRPIAVTMSFLAILILGTVSLKYIPISLLPDIDIPEVTVQIHGENLSARELENSAVLPLRRSLQQTSHLLDIKSETQHEHATIRLRFDYDADIDYTFIEVNEKIDQAMSSLPRSMPRPRAIKASATDIPVFYLHVSNDSNSHQTSTQFIELSRFAEHILRKRIEQLPQVALVDMSGMVQSEIVILPNMEKLQSLGISLGELEQLVTQHHVQLGSLIIRDGQYQYNVHVDSELRDIRDIQQLYLHKDGKVHQLCTLAIVEERMQKQAGMVTMNHQSAISLAIIKQGDVQMNQLREALHTLIQTFEQEYPHLHFEISRDQTQLLDFALENLQESLVWGIGLAFFIMFFFLKDFRSPFLIGISVPVSVIITLLLFHVLGITLNIISLSGLILGVGMMVDNSIIVIDNIAQLRERGMALLPACVKGTSEVISPMLSSVLTTCAVFLPLIFLSGISGAIFYDQAMAVTIGLFISLAVSITLLPVYYRLFYQREKEWWADRQLKKLNTLQYENLYERGFTWVMRHQKISWGAVIVMLLVGAWIYTLLPKTKLPTIPKSDSIVVVDWNERIHLDENKARMSALLQHVESDIVQNVAFIGQQQFLLSKEDFSTAQSSVYLKAKDEALLLSVKEKVKSYLSSTYPSAIYSFEEADNVFDLIFSKEEPPLVIRLQARNDYGQLTNEPLKKIHSSLEEGLGERLTPIPWDDYLLLKIDAEKLVHHHLSMTEVANMLKTAFHGRKILSILSGQEEIPILLGEKEKSVNTILNETLIHNRLGQTYPLREFMTVTRGYDLKTIVAGREGEYFPIPLWEEQPALATDANVAKTRTQVEALVAQNPLFRVDFTGSIFDNKALLHELILILTISLVLLYFILASQFESLTLPLIILLEVPIDIAGAFLFLHIFGASLNLMSMIGIVVMSGVIVNDSILKLDTIIQLQRQEGMSIMRALLVAGQRRLKPILMTSLTTMLGVIPVLFSEGLGAELQKPLAIAIVGGMTFGTVVSLYFIPLCYYYLVHLKRKAV
jgi:multidrug efflux pump subunit AcrB